MTSLPFLVRPGLQTEAVGTPEIGIVHFLQMGDVAVAEDPPSLQKRNDMTLEMVLVLEDVAERISKSIGVPVEHCRAKVYSRQSKRDPNAVELATIESIKGTQLTIKSDSALSAEDWLEVHDQIVVVKKVLSGWKDGTAEYEIAELGQQLEPGSQGLVLTIDIDSYLTKDERIGQMKTQIEIPEIAIEAATLLIQNRVLYPVQLMSDVAPNTKSVQLTPISFEIEKGDRIKFPNKTLEVTANISPTPMEVDAQGLAIAPAPGQLRAGDVGYVMRNGSYLKGAPEWTFEDTRRLGKKLVDDIYEFYKRERASVKNDDDGDGTTQSGNEKNLLSESEPVLQ